MEAPPKKATETQKIVESKKTPEPSTEKTPDKVPEKNKADALMKKSVTILKRPAQPEVSPDNLPSTSEQKNVVDQPESTSQIRTPAPFSLEAELAKIKIPIPITELMSRGGYRS